MDWLTHKVRLIFEQRGVAVTEDIIFNPWVDSLPDSSSSEHDE